MDSAGERRFKRTSSKDAEGAAVILGILQRYVMGEVLRAFALALLSMTLIFVLFMVMAEASKFGLSPRDIMMLVPFVIPRTLPFTVPVSMLFSVTVVYGRLASDNEIIAVKTSGQSAMTVLWPAIIMGGSLSLGLLYLSQEAIPHANIMARKAIFKNFEDAFYKWLKVEGVMANKDWPFTIKVRDVDIETRIMYYATFRHREANNPLGFDWTVMADKAKINFDTDKHFARVYLLENAEITEKNDWYNFNGEYFDMEMPDKSDKGAEKQLQEWTSAEMAAEQKLFRIKIANERKKQAIDAAMWIASGRIDRVRWSEVNAAFVDYAFWTRRINEFETEKHFRIALSFGSLMFVLLGAPVGILFAKRDFLSAFITCFVPIILLYYPLMMLGQNLGKEQVLNPLYTLWSGNLLLGILAGFALPPVIKH